MLGRRLSDIMGRGNPYSGGIPICTCTQDFGDGLGIEMRTCLKKTPKSPCVVFKRRRKQKEHESNG